MAEDASRGAYWNPFPPCSCLKSSGELRVRRQRAPVGKVAFHGGEEVWLVTRYSDGPTTLSDARLGAPDRRGHRRDAA